MSFSAVNQTKTDLGVLNHVAFWVCLIVIIGVAARDMYWTVATQDYLLENELNPVGRWLIQMDQGRVALFVSLKTFGTALAASFLTLLHLLRYRLTLIIVASIAILQICLLVYLELG